MLPGKPGLNLTQQIAHYLGASIISGHYGDHNPIPSEAVLCEQLDVSRAAAREAVKSLAAKGLLSSRARQGIRVLPEQEWNLFDTDVLTWIRESNPSLELLRELAQLRVAIEPEAALLATEKQDIEKIEKIGFWLDRMSKAESGLDDPLESDIAFHLAILDASGNRFFRQFGRIIDTTLRVSIRFSGRRVDYSTPVHEEHQRVYDAIVANKPMQAKQAATDLMTDTIVVIDEALKKGKVQEAAAAQNDVEQEL